MKKLPKGWIEVQLIELLSAFENGSRPKGGVQGILDGIPSLGGEHINSNGGFRFDKMKFIPVEFANSLNRGKISISDILIVKDGATTGKTSFVKDFPYETAFVNEHVFLCRPYSFLNAKSIFYFLWGKEGQERILKNFTGSAQGGINQKFASNTLIPVPPQTEQERIVEKLDALFASLEVIKAKLDRIPKLLKTFRQQVLTRAVTGRLTEEWRLAAEADGRELGEWKKKPLSEFADSRLGKMLDKNKNTGELMDYLRNINVRWFEINFSNIYQLRISPKEAVKYKLEYGDILICEGGEPGRAAIWKSNRTNIIFQKALHRVRLNSNVLPEFFIYNIFIDATRNKLDDLFTGTTIKHLTGQNLAKYQIAIPPLKEQQEIVRRVEELFAIADTVEAQYQLLKAKVDKLPQAILAKAFRGELVPQNPADEPAEVLLERIRGHNSGLSSNKTKSRKKTNG